MSGKGQWAVWVGALAVTTLAALGGSASSSAGPASAAAVAGDTRDLRLAADQPSQAGPTAEAAVAAAKAGATADGRTSVVVKLKDASLLSYRGGVAGLAATSPRANGTRRLDPSSRSSRLYLAYLHTRMRAFEARTLLAIPSATVTHRFDTVLGAESVVIPAADIGRLAADPAVAAIYPDTLVKPQTDVTPGFIGAPTAWRALGGQEKAGERVIVGVIDTGIWPEHPSLSDPDPSGKPYAAPRPPLSGVRQCDFASGANPGPAFACNDKLIGAYTFLATYRAVVGQVPAEYTSARDDDGHGTHTATTAAGNAGVRASIFGVPRGTVSGVAPRAQIIAYKALGLEGGYGSDLAAALQQAIIDDVDVINYSISGGSSPYADVASLAMLDAYNAGIFIAASAGNSGPGADTVDHREPWVTTVAASTANRSFAGTIRLHSSDGATLILPGTSVSAPQATPFSVVDAAAAPFNDPQCQNATPDGAFSGKIVICLRGGNGRVEKGLNVALRGANGMLLANDSAAVTDLETDNHFLPALHVQFKQGQDAVAFLGAHPNVTATIKSGVASAARGDVMASFSSRGGPNQALGVSKPDVTAPGVQVLAGNTPTPADPAGGPPGQLFQAIAGTSMSSPHVAGAGALLHALHPAWTPGQIHSALMTTARTKVVKEDGVKRATAFDDGSGRIDLTGAGTPYFTFDETAANYLADQNALYEANYPSLYVPALSGQLTVARTITSVSSIKRPFTLTISSPRDLKLSVSPARFTLGGARRKRLTIVLDGRDVPIGATRFAAITFTSGTRKFTFPVTIVRRQGPVAVEHTCAPDPVAVGGHVDCSTTLTNPQPADANVLVAHPIPAQLALTSLPANGRRVGSTLFSAAHVPGRLPAEMDVAAGGSPAGGYLPLSLFGAAPIAGVGDDTITNFNVTPFTVAGVTYSRLGVASNGYLVLGGGDAGDVSIVNQNLPNAARPNNVLAPFWTDLNPAAAGAIRISTLTDGTDTWIVVDWDGVREFSSGANTHQFEVWIGIASDPNPAEDVSMAYGANTGSGDGGFATVGAENPEGNRGQVVYFNGTGTIPVNGTQLRVIGTPAVVSSTVVTFGARARVVGRYVSYAEVKGDSFDHLEIGRFAGRVTK